MSAAARALCIWAAVIAATTAATGAPSAPPTAADLAGTWAGTLEHGGERQPVALDLTPGDDGKIGIALTVPVVHLDHAVLGRVALTVHGDSVRLGPFAFAYDGDAKTLTGIVPAGLVPVYAIPVRLRWVERFEAPPRPALAARTVRPVWTYDAKSPLWAGPTFAEGRVYVGAQDGTIHALDARTGTARWTYRTGGAIRTRPSVAGAALFVQSDDGYLYALGALDGALRWKAKLVEGPIVRLPFDDPKSRFDRFGSDVTVADGRLFVGTHDGRVVALDRADGRRLWEFASGDAVLAAPAVAGGRVYFGSYDRSVYALDAATGTQVWKRDTQGAVVSTPALLGDRLVVGNRCYDLLGLHAGTGEIAWKRYVWMSWVESSATIRDGIAYVGSSDAAAVFAHDARDGRRVWATDVYGWAWGQPAVTDRRIYAGTSSQVGYLAQHRGGLLALDRRSGAVVWRYASAAPDSGAYGIPGSPALGAGRVFASGLDGRVYAFEP